MLLLTDATSCTAIATTHQEVDGHKLLRYLGSKLVPLQNATVQDFAAVARQLAGIPPAIPVQLYDLITQTLVDAIDMDRWVSRLYIMHVRHCY
jgi:hypothetical protein